MKIFRRRQIIGEKANSPLYGYYRISKYDKTYT